MEMKGNGKRGIGQSDYKTEITHNNKWRARDFYDQNEIR